MEHLNTALKRLMLASHVLFIIGTVAAFMRGFYVLGVAFLATTITSILYHWNHENCQHTELVDTVLATTFTFLISGYVFYDAYNNKPGGCMISLLIIGLLILPPLFFIAYNCRPEGSEHKMDKISMKMTYRVFHLLWHIVGGMLAIFAISIIHTDPVLNLFTL